jgi:hypothetical protein
MLTEGGRNSPAKADKPSSISTQGQVSKLGHKSVRVSVLLRPKAFDREDRKEEPQRSESESSFPDEFRKATR